MKDIKLDTRVVAVATLTPGLILTIVPYIFGRYLIRFFSNIAALQYIWLVLGGFIILYKDGIKKSTYIYVSLIVLTFILLFIGYTTKILGGDLARVSIIEDIECKYEKIFIGEDFGIIGGRNYYHSISIPGLVRVAPRGTERSGEITRCRQGEF